MDAIADGDACASQLEAWLRETRAWTEAQLDRFVPPEEAHPEHLHGAMRYALFGGGKRLRPALVRMIVHHFGGDDELAARPAVALELVHTYSLVHDDLPCMDDDELRRGRPTCHVAYDEATAVLTGDALLTLAFEVLVDERGDSRVLCKLVRCLASASGSVGMVGGQVLDLSLESGATLEMETLSDMQGRKTAALFRAAAEMGALAAGAAEQDCIRARNFGSALGLAFQAVDDLLDATGDASTLGKTPGKDAHLLRPTMVAALGLEGARLEAERLTGLALGALTELGGSPESLLGLLVEYVLRRRA